MTWFKVDDGFYDHPKVVGLDTAAIGLWALAGSYCARHLTDGVITARQIKAIGGTVRQAEKLVAAGLWSTDDAPPSSRRYFFNDWRDFQPTRKSILNRRAIDAQNKREARAAKRAKQQKRENVRMDVRTDVGTESASLSAGESAGESALPDPTRPDPTYSLGTTSQPSNGDQARANLAGGELTLDELAAATRRARAAGIPEAAIEAGTREFDQRPHPKGPGLLRTLIDEAAAVATAKNRDEQAKAARRAAIDACPDCDNRGLKPTPQGLARCNHTPTTRPRHLQIIA